MKLRDIRDEVKVIVNDSGFSDDDIDSYINQAAIEAASQLSLCSQKGIDTVLTDAEKSYVSLSTIDGGFIGRLLRVYDSEGNKIYIANSLEELFDNYGSQNELGDIRAVCLDSNVLWYVKTPSTPVTLTILYYKPIEILVDDDDTPNYFPAFSHRNLLVHGACGLMFDIFEDGVDGNKVNTIYHKGQTQNGIAKVLEWIGRNKQHNVYSIWRD